jgi:hypothetical protein
MNFNNHTSEFFKPPPPKRRLRLDVYDEDEGTATDSSDVDVFFRKSVSSP